MWQGRPWSVGTEKHLWRPSHLLRKPPPSIYHCFPFPTLHLGTQALYFTTNDIPFFTTVPASSVSVWTVQEGCCRLPCHYPTQHQRPSHINGSVSIPVKHTIIEIVEVYGSLSTYIGKMLAVPICNACSFMCLH